MVFMAMLFFSSCTDTYKRVGDEAKKTIFPVGVAENFTLTYTEAKEVLARDTIGASKVIAVLAANMGLVLELSNRRENSKNPFLKISGNKLRNRNGAQTEIKQRVYRSMGNPLRIKAVLR